MSDLKKQIRAAVDLYDGVIADGEPPSPDFNAASDDLRKLYLQDREAYRVAVAEVLAEKKYHFATEDMANDTFHHEQTTFRHGRGDFEEE